MKTMTLTSSLSGSIALALATPAYAAQDTQEVPEAPEAQAAQEPAAEPATTAGPSFGGEILVRAQRRAQDSIDVPVQVSALGQEALSDANVTTLEDIGDRIPNTYFGAPSGYGPPAFSIRGVGGTLSTGGEEPVAIFFDDQFIPRSFPSALLDIESVEVLRGPQVTLYGRNATAGAVLLRSARPKLGEVEGYAKGQYGNYNTSKIEAGVSLPVGDTFAVRLAGLRHHTDGWVTNIVNGAKMDRNTSWRGRVSALWEPASNIEIYGNLEIGEADFSIARAGIGDRANGGNRVLISEAALDSLRDGNFAANSPIDNFSRDTRATLSATIGLGGVDLVAAAGYFETRFGGSTDSDGTAANILSNTGEFYFKTWSQDLRLVSTGKHVFDWIVGFSALQDSYEMPFFNITNVPVNRRSRFGGRVPADAYAVYAEGTLNVTDAFSITAGGRYTIETKNAAINFASFDLTTGAQVAAGTYANEKTWRAFKPRLIVQVAASDRVNFYGSVSTGFKSGGYNVFALSAPYNDENIVAYELGMKGRFLDNMLTASAAVFHYDYTDLQLRLGVPTGGVVIQNAADAKIEGLETEAALNLRNGLELYGSFSLLDAKINRYLTRNLSGVLVDAAGARMSRAPKFSMSAGGSYTAEVGNGLEARLAASFTHRSEVFFLETDQDAPTFRGRPVDNLDLRASFGRADKGWEIAGFVKNATNSVEVTQIELQGNFPMATFSEPRKYGVELAVRF